MKRMTLNAAELDKYIILTGYFHFQTELLENVLEDELYGKLYKELQFCADNTTSKGVLITDTYSNALYIGTIFDDNSMQLISFYSNQADIIDINIALDNQLNITKETETFISEDNVKTLFGDQSIIGSGNIDLYNHQLLINDDCYFNIISSNNLVIDSIQDLTNVLKPTTKNIYYFGYQKTTLNTASLEYDKTTNTWKYRSAGNELALVSKVSDILTTI